MSKEGDLMVYWIPQIGADIPRFDTPVDSIEAGWLLIDTLAMYDLFQYENRIKPDYANAGGLLVFEGGEWLEWEHPETGIDIREHMEGGE